MKVKATIVVMSHLSDASLEKNNVVKQLLRIRFVKYIIHKIDGNLNQDIDADKMYNDFLEFDK